MIGSEKVFLGLFGKKLKVEVTLPERSLLCRGRDFVDDLLKLMDLRADTVLREEENVVDIEGQDAEILVGRHGDGLKSMEYLLNLALRDPGSQPRVRLDSNGYRERDFVDDLLKLMELRAHTILCEEENVVDIEGQDAEIPQ